MARSCVTDCRAGEHERESVHQSSALSSPRRACLAVDVKHGVVVLGRHVRVARRKLLWPHGE